MSSVANILPSVSVADAAGARLDRYDWADIADALDRNGAAVLRKLLSLRECQEIAALYPREALFRSHVVMARHGFGKGEYRYFNYPLPDLIGGLRAALYARLAPIADAWSERLGHEARYPAEHAAYLVLCHAAG